MVAGIPNTGKSTIINTISGGKRAETGDKAGVTRANKWIRLGDFELLDTPGTMPPSFENQTYAKHLAYIGSLNDDILDTEGLALELIDELKIIAPDKLMEKYSLTSLDKEPLALYDDICKRRGFLLRGGVRFARRNTLLRFRGLKPPTLHAFFPAPFCCRLCRL